MAKKVKITVIKTAFHADLVEKYCGRETYLPCTMNPEGSVYYTNGWRKPKGLCDNAWKCMANYALALASGGGHIFDGWMKNDKQAVVSCDDGLRPVTYLLEALDEEIGNDDPSFE